MRLDDADLARREPVWKALSTLWLDDQPTPRALAWIAGILNDSGFTVDELREIYLYEVAPTVHGKLRRAAGAHPPFDEPWLFRKARQRAEHRSVWLRLWIAAGVGRQRLTSEIDPYWSIVVDLLERMRARGARITLP